MNTKTVITQIKRELWENKVSFINTPVIISLLVILASVVAMFYSGNLNFRHEDGFILSAEHSVIGESGAANGPVLDTEDNSGSDNDKKLKSYNMFSSIASDPTAFNGIVLGVMYVNCVFLLLVFFIVLLAYSLRCLFDDRKNKDILFWRSMPVSETTNVLVKLAMFLLVAPVIVLALNFIVTLVIFFIGLIFLGVNGVELGYLISSVLKGGALYIPFQICYELMFSLLMLMPVIGFAFFASAFAKKTPFFTFVSPLVLVLIDRIFNSIFGINIGVVKLLSVYVQAIVNAKAAFVLQVSFTLESSMILPLLICVGIGALFIAGAIWLRNNRYEI